MELTTELLLALLTSLALGALIGAEREMNKAKDAPRQASFAGLRTYSLVAVLGFVGAYLGDLISPWILVVLLLAVTAFFLTEHVGISQKLSFFGITSEITALMTFLIGVIVFYNSLLGVILGVITVLLLAFKQRLHQFVETLAPDEFLSAIKFIIVAFVILPLLPREPVDPWGLITPFNAWLMVVFVSGISFVGYILVKAIGTKKGLNLTALVGGLASSTATTMSMAQQGKRNKKIVIPFVSAIIVTSTIMFIRALLEVAVVNRDLLGELSMTLGAMIGMSVLILGFIWLRGDKKEAKTEDLELSSPFQLWPALQFGALYVIILLAAELGNRYFGEQGIYVASLVAGLADIDAITLSLSNLSAEGNISNQLAVTGITIAVMTNTLVKLGIVGLFSTRALFRRSAVAILLIILSAVGVLFLG